MGQEYRLAKWSILKEHGAGFTAVFIPISEHALLEKILNQDLSSLTDSSVMRIVSAHCSVITCLILGCFL